MNDYKLLAIIKLLLQYSKAMTWGAMYLLKSLTLLVSWIISAFRDLVKKKKDI